jgi:hypothetical protein
MQPDPVLTVNHWGKWVTSDQPVTGVTGINHCPEWLFDDISQGIDLTCRECDMRSNCQEEDCCDVCERGGPVLIGTWREDAQGLFEPDPEGEYAAIAREEVVQVVYSRATRRGALCSPCYPGQVDLDTPGDFLGFCLPEEK